MNRLLRNTSWIMLNQIFNMVLSFFVGILTIKYLGPANYGSITYISSYVAFFSAAATMGLDTVVVSRLVKEPERDGEIMASAILLRSMFSLLCMACLCLVIAVVDRGDRPLLLIAFLSGFEIFFKAFGTITFWYQWKLESRKTAIADMIAFTLASIYRIWLLATHKNVYWFACYTSLIYLLAVLIYIPMFRRDCTTPLKPVRETCRELFRECLPYMLSGVMISMYTQIDRVMIKHMISKEAVGFYAAAVTVCNLIAFIPASLSLSARPVLLRLREENDPGYDLRITQVLAAIVWLSLAYSVFITIAADRVIPLMFGEAYAPAGGVLRLMVWCTIVENLTRIRDLWLIGEKQSRYVTVFSLTGTVLNILCNAALIPLFGIYGAAAATVITQFAVMWLLPALFPQTRGFAVNLTNAVFLRGVRVKALMSEVFGRKEKS